MEHGFHLPKEPLTKSMISGRMNVEEGFTGYD
jgi:hypothetical protein